MKPEEPMGTAASTTGTADHAAVTVAGTRLTPAGRPQAESGLRWDREPGNAPPPNHELDENRLRLIMQGQEIGFANVIDCGGFVWIEDIVVRRDRRGAGMGSSLLDAVCDRYGHRMLGLALPDLSEHDEELRELRRWYGRRAFRDGRLLDVDCLVRLPRPTGDRGALLPVSGAPFLGLRKGVEQKT